MPTLSIANSITNINNSRLLQGICLALSSGWHFGGTESVTLCMKKLIMCKDFLMFQLILSDLFFS